MLNGLDLFSGIGGITLALSEWVRPVAYCDNEPYAQRVLLSRMADGRLPVAPIWDNVCTFNAKPWTGRIDIIYGGFPCQDISVAGNGRGLAGERSGLVHEIFRLVDECQPAYIFLENVPAIRTRGGEVVGKELARRGFDCRWTVVSAAEVGAPHLRKRWFLLAAHAERLELRQQQGRGGRADWEGETLFGIDGAPRFMADTNGLRQLQQGGAVGTVRGRAGDSGQPLADAPRNGRAEGAGSTLREYTAQIERGASDVVGRNAGSNTAGRWPTEPNVGRVANGIPKRVDRLRALGNAVVPAQAKEAFERLMGIK